MSARLNGGGRLTVITAICSARTDDDANYIVAFAARDDLGQVWMRIRGESMHWHLVHGIVQDDADAALLFHYAVNGRPVTSVQEGSKCP